MIIGSQEYPWFQHYQNRNLDFRANLDEILKAVRSAGLAAWEPGIPDEASIPSWRNLLGRHGLQMPSAYLGGVMHEGDEQKIVADAVGKASAARSLGVRIIVCNPNPISWETTESKTDLQLRFQARVLEKIGEGLKAQGQTLAYHTHSPEMLCGAREFTHMMRAVNPNHMGFCFDVHWIFRGCGNSQLAVEDILGMHGQRIVSLHLRQSQGGVWTEHLQDGDVDYAPLWNFLKQRRFDGPAIIETACEKGTPGEMSMEQSHRLSREWIEAFWK